MRCCFIISALSAVIAAVYCHGQTSEALPDLVLWHGGVKPFTQTKNFTANGCEVVEGCIGSGTRRLLRFNIESRNQGLADLILGSPVGNPLFEYAACHGHYHFRDFVEARLLDSNNVLVASGGKIGFCLEDSYMWDPNGFALSRYDCQFQGIQRGWADLYSANLSCQYIDIGNVPAGEYVLELEIDPENRLRESNEDNNVIRVPLVLPGPCAAPPANDSFAGATPITDARAQIRGDSNCATPEPGDPLLASGRSVWFRWTAPFSGDVIISTDGGTFDSILGVYTGNSIGTLSTVAVNDDGGFGRNALVRFSANGGTVYRIEVDGYQGMGGEYTLNIIPGTNDHFRNCAPLIGAAGNIRDYNIYSTAEPGEPAHAGNFAMHSVWYCWTAPFSGPVNFDTAGSSFDTVLAVYTGSSLSGLTLVASNDNYEAPWTTSRVSFNATSNTVYRIAVDGRNGFLGMVLLRWAPPLRVMASKKNDMFELRVSSAPGDQCAVEASQDLQHWMIWRRAFNTNGTLLLNDSVGARSQRFYRLFLE